MRIVSLTLLWPLLVILLSKRDLEGAFKRVLLALKEIGLFASDLPAEELLRAAWEQVTSEELAELLAEIAALVPELGKMKPEAAVQFLAEEICRIKYGRDMMDPRCEREADTAGLTRCVLRRRAEIRERRRSAREDLKRIGQEAIVMVRKAVREEALAFIRRKGGHAKRVAEAKHYLLRRGEHAGKEERFDGKTPLNRSLEH